MLWRLHSFVTWAALALLWAPTTLAYQTAVVGNPASYKQAAGLGNLGKSYAGKWKDTNGNGVKDPDEEEQMGRQGSSCGNAANGNSQGGSKASEDAPMIPPILPPASNQPQNQNQNQDQNQQNSDQNKPQAPQMAQVSGPSPLSSATGDSAGMDPSAMASLASVGTSNGSSTSGSTDPLQNADLSSQGVMTPTQVVAQVNGSMGGSTGAGAGAAPAPGTATGTGSATLSTTTLDPNATQMAFTGQTGGALGALAPQGGSGATTQASAHQTRVFSSYVSASGTVGGAAPHEIETLATDPSGKKKALRRLKSAALPSSSAPATTTAASVRSALSSRLGALEALPAPR